MKPEPNDQGIRMSDQTDFLMINSFSFNFLLNKNILKNINKTKFN